jgi:hypothetical protein
LARKDVAARIFGLVGDPPLKTVDIDTGWPSGGELTRDSGLLPISAHVSTVGPHARRPYEFRFQNPGDRTPVSDQYGFPLLIGLAEEKEQEPCLIVVDGRTRLGREARFSILFNRSIIEDAVKRGVSLYISKSGERIYGTRPEIFPTVADIIASGVEVPLRELQQAVSASGFLEDGSEQSAKRTRRAAEILVRDHAFGRDVKAAYDNKCAMCGLSLRMVVGAHIYPVSAPGSEDKVWNGLCLCANHHAAFDNHDIAVKPATTEIVFSPTAVSEAKTNKALSEFIEKTFEILAKPNDPALAPKREMFQQRIEFYEDAYDWLKY